MKKNAMRKNLRQSILNSLGRYIAIVAIIALGASMFVGLLMTKTDMVATGQVFMDQQNMFDLRLVSSYGWTQKQVDAVSQLEGVVDAEGMVYLDAVARLEDAEEDAVFRFYSIPDILNRVSLRGGRMPEAPDECLIDGFMADESYLGKTVTISETNSEDTLDSMTSSTYTIVGYVATPLYLDINRGTTSVGNGSIETYFYIPSEGFDVDYCVEINLTIPGDYDVYSKAYNAAMDAAAETLEPYAEELARERFDEIKGKAEEEYADGYSQYLDGVQELEDGRREMEEELAGAYAQLSDAELELQKNEKLIADGEKQIASGWRAIDDNEKALKESGRELEKAKKETYDQLDAAQAELDKNAQEIAAGLAQVDAGLAQLDAGLAQVNDGIEQLEEGLAQINDGISQLETLMPLLETAADVVDAALKAANSALVPNTEEIARLTAELESIKSELNGYTAQLEELKAMQATYSAQLEELYVTKVELEAAREELLATRQTLIDAQAAIDAGYAELEAGRAEADTQFAEAEAQIADGEQQLQSAKNTLYSKQKELNEGKAALEDGRRELEEGWQEYYDGKAEAEAEIADAEAELAEAQSELADAREEIDSLEAPVLHVLDRTTNVGYTSLDSASDIVQGVSRVFPAFFLLVAALVCITTMTRMIDEERTQIGTLKALGYSSGAIISKYLVYAGSGAVIGCGLGVIVGSIVFPTILWEAYKIMLYITDCLVLKFNWWLIGAVVISYTAVMLLVTWYCCRRTLEEEPAELIRPKAPAAGKKIFMEYLPFWHQISFLNKVTIRNIFRYRQRLAMMLVGIGGCTALLVTGFGLRDSIVNVVGYQFEEVTTYDMAVYFSEGMTAENQEQFLRQVGDKAENIIFYHQSSIEVDFESQTKEIYLIAAKEQVREFMDFHSGEKALTLPGINEVLLSAGVAEMMGIEVGDRISMRNADMQVLELTVSGIYDNHVHNYAVLSPETIEVQWGEPAEEQMAFVKAAEEQEVHEVGALISGIEGVMNVSISEDLADMVGNMMEALDLVVIVVVVCAGLLAVIVLYNLTNININERIREIATIKVLGFNAVETGLYVFKENLALSVIGAVLGLGLGQLLLTFVISQIKIDMVWFKAQVMPMSYILSVLLTVFSAIVVDLIFYFKLEKINMAEALKSVE